MLHGVGKPSAERPLLSDPVLIANAVATLAMVGLIWFVQVVHYPMLARVDADGAAEHQRRTGYVVAAPMVVEGATALLLAADPPSGVSTLQASIGLGLLVVIWLATLLLQVPRHRELARAVDADTVGRLVAGNWVRTVAWTARAAVVVSMLATAS